MSEIITLPRSAALHMRDDLRGRIAVADDDCGEEGCPDCASVRAMRETLTVIEKALNQPKREPVAYWHRDKGFYWAKPTFFDMPTVTYVPPLPLYAEEQEFKP